MSDCENGLERGDCRVTARAICAVIPKFMVHGNFGLTARCLRGFFIGCALPFCDGAPLGCTLFKGAPYPVLTGLSRS